jgi:hypothetical protein
MIVRNDPAKIVVAKPAIKAMAGFFLSAKLPCLASISSQVPRGKSKSAFPA